MLGTERGIWAALLETRRLCCVVRRRVGLCFTLSKAEQQLPENRKLVREATPLAWCFIKLLLNSPYIPP